MALPDLLRVGMGSGAQAEPVSERTALPEQPRECDDGQYANGKGGADAHEGEQHTIGVGQEKGSHSGYHAQSDQTDDHLYVDHMLCSPF